MRDGDDEDEDEDDEAEEEEEEEERASGVRPPWKRPPGVTFSIPCALPPPPECDSGVRGFPPPRRRGVFPTD
jgi:hypothetical protein